MDTLDSLREEMYNKLCDRCKKLADENITGKWCQKCQEALKADKDFQKRLDAVISKSLKIQ
jgi:hypothetical protein